MNGKLVYKLYTADIWAVSLVREVRVVIVDYLAPDKKTQTRKVFFSTDLSLSARDKDALVFAFIASLSSINVARAHARQEGLNLSVGATKTLLHNAAMVDRFIAMSAKHANLRLNITLISKNSYSTAFAPWRKLYKINELLP